MKIKKTTTIEELDISLLSLDEKVKLVGELVEDSIEEGDFFENIIINLEESNRENLIGNLVSKYPNMVIDQTKYWNSESPEFMGYDIDNKEFLKWLEKNHANCFVAKFAGDAIEEKIKQYIKEVK